MNFSSISMHLVTLTVPLTMSNFAISHAAPDHDLQKMLHCQIKHSHLNSSRGNLLTYVWPSCKQAGSAFIADDHLLQHLTIPAGVPPLDISHQPLPECFAGPEIELQAPAMHCRVMHCRAGSNLALFPPLMR